EMNTDETSATLNPTGDVFLAPDASLPNPTNCTVTYSITALTNHLFQAKLAIANTGATAVDRWTTNFELSQGQRVCASAGTVINQTGSNAMNVTAQSPLLFNDDIAPNQTVHASFTATWDGLVNHKPPNFSLNGQRCSVT